MEVPMYVFSVINWSNLWHFRRERQIPWYGDTLETELRIRRREARGLAAN
jgi:hypothetical protein